MEPIDVELSAALDEPGEMLPLMTLGELRVTRYVADTLGKGDGPGSAAARDLVARLDRRLEVMLPDADILFHGEITYASWHDDAPRTRLSGRGRCGPAGSEAARRGRDASRPLALRTEGGRRQPGCRRPIRRPISLPSRP